MLGGESMKRQQYAELGLEVPSDWQDDTVLRYVGPKLANLGECPEISVAARPLPEGQSIDAVAARDLMALAKLRKTLVIEDSLETELGGRRAIEQRYSWQRWERELDPGEEPTDNGGPIAVRQLYVAVDHQAYVVTVTTGVDAASRALPVVDSILKTIRFGTEDKQSGA